MQLPTKNCIIISLQFNEINILLLCRYYSSAERKYLKMSFEGRNVTKHDQARALKNGLQLAWALNRTLILPKFHCDKGYCNFLDIFGYCISILDEMIEVTYREQMFLANPLVPENVRASSTDVFDISGKTTGRKVQEDFSVLLQELSPFRNYSVICVSMPYHVIFNFNTELFTHLLPLSEINCKPKAIRV